jgi:transmembrane sensor
MLDDLVARARRVQLATWNDLREQRLLQRSLELAHTRVARARRLKSISIAAGVLTVSAIVVLMATRHFESSSLTAPETRKETLAPVATASQVSTPPGVESVQLSDGSHMTVDSGARYQIAEQVPNRIRILQLAGRISYEVIRGLEREFTVQAADIRVQVTGTRFVVNLSEDWVDIHVDAGRIEVNDGTRITPFLAGEDLRVHAWHVPSSRPTNGQGSSAPTDSQAPTPSRVANETAASLLTRADKARMAGRVSEAIDLLQSLVSRYPTDSRLPVALFTLGRLEAGQQRYAAAAGDFARCRRASAGSLAEDALAEEATVRKQAGSVNEARALARQYVEQYPKGTHSKRMRALFP